MDFVDIEKPAKPVKILLRGPTGAGKTFVGLLLANAFAADKPVAFLDSEAGRGMLFAGTFPFKYASLSGNYSPDKYIEGIKSAVKAGMGAILLDSLTQAWKGVGGVLDQVRDKGGNSFTDGWGKVGTPLQVKFTDAIITSTIPIICTVRSKMAYEIEKNDAGKSVPRAVGMAPEQRDDLSYEFDFILDISMDHDAIITKMPPIPGMEKAVMADGYLAWAKNVQAWMATGKLMPQTWLEIKARIAGDPNKLELAKQLYNEKKTVAEAWEIISKEPETAETQSA